MAYATFAMRQVRETTVCYDLTFYTYFACSFSIGRAIVKHEVRYSCTLM